MCFGWALREAAKPPSRAQATHTLHAARQVTRAFIPITIFFELRAAPIRP
jgi:hypothetical protein